MKESTHAWCTKPLKIELSKRSAEESGRSATTMMDLAKLEIDVFMYISLGSAGRLDFFVIEIRVSISTKNRYPILSRIRKLWCKRNSSLTFRARAKMAWGCKIAQFGRTHGRMVKVWFQERKIVDLGLQSALSTFDLLSPWWCRGLALQWLQFEQYGAERTEIRFRGEPGTWPWWQRSTRFGW